MNSPDYFQSILESMMEPVYIRDRDMSILYMNRAAENMTGWRFSEVSAMKCYEVFGDCGGHCREACLVDRVIRDESPLHYSDGEVVTREGQSKKLRVSISPLKEDGQVTGGIVIMEDISVLRRLEEVNLKTYIRLENALEEAQISRKHLEESQRIARLGSWNWNVRDDTSQCSEEYFRLFDLPYKPAGFTHQQFINLVHPDDRDRINRAMERTIREGSDYDETYRIILPGGSEKIHHARGIAKTDEAGDIVNVVGVQHDVTEIHRIREALETSERRYSLALDAVSDAIWDTRMDQENVYFSPKWYTMLGYEPYELPQSYDTWRGLLHPDDADRAVRIIDESIESGESFETEFRMKTRDNRWKWIMARGKSVEKDRDGRAVRMMGTHVDIGRLKESEEEILRQKQTAERYLNMAGVIFIGLDLDGNITIANNHACDVLECCKEDIIGWNWFASFIPDDITEEVRSVFQKLVRGDIEPVTHYENKVRTMKGDIRTVAWHNTYITDDKGRITQLLSAGEDITEKRNLEERYRSIIQTSLDGFIRSDINGRFLEVNQAYCRMTGYEEEELRAMNITDVEENESPEIVRERIRRLMETGHDQFETVHTKKNGTGIDLEVMVQYRENENEFVSFVKDITERMRQEKDLNFQSLLLDQIQDHVTATDLAGNIIYVNEAECRTMKRSREDLMGNSVDTYGEDPDRGATQDEIVRETLGKGRWRGEVVNYTGDGREIILDCRTRLIRDGEGNPLSMVGISTDITEKKKISERLKQTQKLEAIGSLAGGIAHDFNNLLTPIIGMAELLLEELPPRSDAHGKVEDILEAGTRGAHLVQQILACSRKGNHKVIPVRMDQIIDEVCKLIRSTLPANADVIREIDSRCGPVRADPTQIHQVVMNILTNAFHAVESQKGVIRIRLEEKELDGENLPGPSMEPGRFALLSIADNGTGIPERFRDKIFEPYFTTKAQGKGTGLGLAVVYGIVKEHHGEITVESEEGRGTVFGIYLPVMKEEKSGFDGITSG